MHTMMTSTPCVMLKKTTTQSSSLEVMTLFVKFGIDASWVRARVKQVSEQVFVMRNNFSVVGVLEGHMEGITHISSKGDGKYFISNGKDQCIKLWDIRKMKNKTDGKRVN